MLTIQGNGARLERSTAAGTAAFRLIAVEAGASLTVDALTLQNGRSEGATGRTPGAGLILNHGEVVLRDVTVQNNTTVGAFVWNFGLNEGPAALGGCIYTDGSLTIAGGIVRNNQAIGATGADASGGGVDAGDGLGGGVYVGGGTADLTAVALTENVARGGNGGDGGKWFYRGQTFYGSGGDGGDGRGGGLYAAGGTTTLTGCSVSRNVAAGGTGGRTVGRGSIGAKGVGEGGGIYVGVGVAADWDAATSITRNTASVREGKDVFRA